jgi:DNA (cytosine-5)-methyltransferase 1
VRYLSVCSGIEAASVAWHPLGWRPAAFSEIEPFPSAVLSHHYPAVPNVGDMTKFKEWEIGAIDLLVGGTPCQSFSVAGLRKGLEDPRGNLALVYCGILDRFKPKWFIWENVPGVLSSSGGRDFGSFLGAVAELGYGFAYRVLDAQFFGVAQRRRRVFVVGCLGDWRSAAEVLFEPEGLRGDPAPSRETGQEVAGSAAQCFDRQSSGEYGTAPVASTVSARDYKSASDLVAYNITFCDANGRRSDRPNGGLYVNETELSGTITRAGVGTSVLQKIDAVQAISTYSTPAIGNIVADNLASTMTKNTGSGGETQNPAYVVQPKVMAFSGQMSEPQVDTEMTQTLGSKNPMAVMHPVAPTLTASNDPSRSPQSTEVTNQVAAVHAASMAVRRLTPVECERLQGFPDNYTNITWRKQPESPDGPRYKALGNSMAVPVMAWIGKRIQQMENV